MKPCVGCVLAQDRQLGYKCVAGCPAWLAWCKTVPIRKTHRRPRNVTRLTVEKQPKAQDAL